MSTNKALTFRRLGIEQPTPSAIDQSIAINEQRAARSKPLTAPATLTLPSAPRSWRFLPGPAGNDPWGLSYSRHWPAEKTQLLTDEPSVDAALDQARRYHDELRERIDGLAGLDNPKARLRRAWLLGEADVAKKISVQKGRRPDAHLARLGVPPEIASIPSEWEAMLRRVLGAYTDALGSDTEVRDGLLKRPDPSDTNAGFPTFGSGPYHKLISGLCAMTGWADTLELAEGVCAGLGLPTEFALSFGLSYRAGTAHKPWPVWDEVGYGAYRATTAVSHSAPRARHVYMGPMSSNVLLRPLWAALLAAQKHLPGLNHAGTADDDLVRETTDRLPWVYESDISGFDQHVLAILQDAVLRAGVAEWPHLAEEWRIWREMERRPITGPSWLTTARGEFRSGVTLVGAYGGTHSGLKTTATIGTLICVTTVLWALEEMRVTPDAVQAWLRGDIGLLCLGDDVLLMMPRQLDTDGWLATWSRVGLTCEAIEGRRFLMKHRMPSGPLPVAARVMQNSLFPEYDVTGPGAAGIAPLGYVARAQGLPVGSGLLRPVSAAIAMTKWARTREGLWKAATDRGSPPPAEAVAIAYERVIREGIAASTKGSGFARLRRDAEHSPSAAAMWAAILRLDPSAAARLDAADMTTYDAIMRLRARNPTMGRRLGVVMRLIATEPERSRRYSHIEDPQERQLLMVLEARKEL